MHSTTCKALLALTICNIIYLSWRITREANSVHYSWQGHDFPTYLPLREPLRTIITPLRDESASYPLLGSASDDEWFGLTTASAGYVRLGPENRFFMVTMYHELHCLRVLNLAFEPGRTSLQQSHVKHCLDYIRQSVLCSPDLAIEKIVQHDDGTEDIVPDEYHECKDWTQADEFMQDRWDEWLEMSGSDPHLDLRVSNPHSNHGHRP